MLRPEPMKRVLIVSSRDHEGPIIDCLHSMGVAHFIDYKEGGIDGFGLGKPMEGGSSASERLVRLRSVARQLGVKHGSPLERTFSAREITDRISPQLTEMELNATSAVEARDRLAQALSELTQEETRLLPLTSIALTLEDYRGYDSLAVFVGTAAPAFKEALKATAPENLLFSAETGAFALFVEKDKGGAVQDLLSKNGFKSLEVPPGTGRPADRIAKIAQEKETLQAKLAATESEIKKLSDQYSAFILAADEHLSISTEKAEAPLSFATTENAFVVDTWVPVAKFHWMAAKLDQVTTGAVHIEEVRSPVHHHDAAAKGHNVAAEPREEPPTLYRNPKAARPFQFFIDLFSRPNYNEIDPTVVFALVFPTFFGFMIGDLGYGILMALIGYWLLTKVASGEGVKELGFALAFAGLVAMLFGSLFFMEAFGVPFGPTPHVLSELHGAATTCAELAGHGETTWGCLFTGQPTPGFLGTPETGVKPVMGKLTHVTDLLALSLVAGLVHMGVGLAFGLVNTAGHGGKHLVAKVGWVFVFLGFMGLVMGITNTIVASQPEQTFVGPLVAFFASPAPFVAYLILGGAALLVYAEGAVGGLEIPTLLTNIISYTRLAGVAVAKGAMVFAFNSLFLVGMVLNPDGNLLIVLVGLVLLVVAQIVIFALGVLASGIQAIRLNYVEFFLKFYSGGGHEFAPFGRLRRYSTV